MVHHVDFILISYGIVTSPNMLNIIILVYVKQLIFAKLEVAE